MVEILEKIARNDSELAYVAHGPLRVVRALGRAGVVRQFAKSTLVNYRGWPVHHAIECFGQVGAVYNMMFNRDDMIHSAVNFQGCGLPIELKTGDSRRGVGRRGRVRPGQELHAHERPQGELRVVVHRHRRAARLAHAVQLGVADDHEPHEGPQLPRRPRPGGQVLQGRHRRGGDHRRPVQGRRQDHDAAAREHGARHDRREAAPSAATTCATSTT